MVEKSKVYEGEPIRTTILRLVLAAQICASAIVAGFIIAAGGGIIRLPEPWHTAYLTVVKSTIYFPSAAIVCLVVWVFRANKNATALSSQPLDHSPGWAVGWFFVPFASLWKPYEVMREIYKASRTPHDWRKAQGAAIIGWWWADYVFGNLSGLLLKGMSALHETVPLRGFSIFLYANVILHQLLLLLIVGRIVKWQAKAHRDDGVEAIF